MLDCDRHVCRRARGDWLRCGWSAPTSTDALRVAAVGVAKGGVRVGSCFVHHAHLLRLVALVRVGVIQTVVVGHVTKQKRVQSSGCGHVGVTSNDCDDVDVVKWVRACVAW